MKKIFAALILYMLVVYITPCSEWTEKFLNKINSISSMKIEFKQINYWEFSNTKLESKGLVYLKEPNLYRIEYTYPEEQIYIFDGSYSYFFMKKEKQVIKSKNSDPLMQLSNYVLNPEKIFNIKYLGFDKTDNELIKFDLSYKDDSNSFNIAGIRMWVHSESLLPQKLEIFSKTKDSIMYKFEKYEVDQEISEEKFEADFPENTDIIEY